MWDIYLDFFALVFLGVILRNNHETIFHERLITQDYWLQLSIIYCVLIFFVYIFSSYLKKIFSNSILVWVGKRLFWNFGLHSAVINAITYKYVNFAINIQNQYITIINSIVLTVCLTAFIADILYNVEKIFLSKINRYKIQ